jgi:hypothetical protein
VYAEPVVQASTDEEVRFHDNERDLTLTLERDAVPDTNDYEGAHYELIATVTTDDNALGGDAQRASERLRNFDLRVTATEENRTTLALVDPTTGDVCGHLTTDQASLPAQTEGETCQSSLALMFDRDATPNGATVRYLLRITETTTLDTLLDTAEVQELDV